MHTTTRTVTVLVPAMSQAIVLLLQILYGQGMIFTTVQRERDGNLRLTLIPSLVQTLKPSTITAL